MAQDPNNTMTMATDLQDSMLVRPFTIRRASKDTYDTFTLELVAQSGPRTFDFIPGQFNMLYVYGVGEVPISISGDATDTKVLVHTIREVGTVTKALRKLKAGDTVGVRGPYGTGWPVDLAVGPPPTVHAPELGIVRVRAPIDVLGGEHQPAHAPHLAARADLMERAARVVRPGDEGHGVGVAGADPQPACERVVLQGMDVPNRPGQEFVGD